MEFPAVGGMLPQSDFRSLKLVRYVNTLDFFILGCEFILLIVVIYYTYESITRIIKKKLLVLWIPWMYVDVIILLVSIIFQKILRWKTIKFLKNNYSFLYLFFRGNFICHDSLII